MANQPCLIYTFLNAVQGNWRNAVYVECGDTTCRRSCCGFLLTFDRDRKAVLLPVDLIQKLTGQMADKSECIAIITREKFESLFSVWLTWFLERENECPALAYMEGCGCQKNSCLLN